MEKFKLSDKFIDKYKRKKAPFGFNGLGELVYMRTYSRIKEDGKNERWWETVQRVVEGTYQMQKNHIYLNLLNYSPLHRHLTMNLNYFQRSVHSHTQDQELL